MEPSSTRNDNNIDEKKTTETPSSDNQLKNKKSNDITENDIVSIAINKVESGIPIKVQKNLIPSDPPIGMEISVKELIITETKQDKTKKYEQKFIALVNNFFEHGIICSKRAEDLEIKQVSSLDKNPRPYNEVEVNFVSDPEGLETAIGISSQGKGNTAAKGALSIALERYQDPLPSKLEKRELDSNDLQNLNKIQDISIRNSMKKLLEKDKGLKFDEHSLEILADRSESCILILMNPQKMSFYDNVTDFQKECKSGTIDRCREIKINANISPDSFELVLIPEKFKHLESSFKKPDNCKICYIESQTQFIAYNYPPLDHNDTRTIVSTILPIKSPNFIFGAYQFLIDNKVFVSHLGKGTAFHDS